MLRTILIGSSIFVQGVFVGQTPDGKTIVRVDEKDFVVTSVA